MFRACGRRDLSLISRNSFTYKSRCAPNFPLLCVDTQASCAKDVGRKKRLQYCISVDHLGFGMESGPAYALCSRVESTYAGFRQPICSCMTHNGIWAVGSTSGLVQGVQPACRTFQNVFMAFVASTLWPKPLLNQNSREMGITYAGIIFFSLVSYCPTIYIAAPA